MRQKLTEMRFHQLIMGLAGHFSSTEEEMQLPSQTQLCDVRVLQLTWIRRAMFTATLQALSSQEELLGIPKTNLHVLSSCRAHKSYGPSFLSEVAVLQPQLAV